jgi:hypothetical protein
LSEQYSWSFVNRRLPAYEINRPRFDATREALCIACIGVQTGQSVITYEGNTSQLKNRRKTYPRCDTSMTHPLLPVVHVFATAEEKANGVSNADIAKSPHAKPEC